MAAPPRDESGNIIVGKLGNQLVLAEELDQQPEQRPCVGRARQMLRVLRPVAPSDIVKPQRGARGLDLRDVRLGALAFLAFYCFGFAPRRLLCRAEKAMTSDLEIVLPERRARVASDRHGESFRVWLATNS